MNKKFTSFAVFTRLVIWGDDLKSKEIADGLDIDPGAYAIRRKRAPSDAPSDRRETARTGRLSISFGKKQNQFDPAEQVEIARKTLEHLMPMKIYELGADRAEFQFFAYYGTENNNAEPDIRIDPEFLRLLVSERIELSISVLR